MMSPAQLGGANLGVILAGILPSTALEILGDHFRIDCGEMINDSHFDISAVVVLAFASYMTSLKAKKQWHLESEAKRHTVHRGSMEITSSSEKSPLPQLSPVPPGGGSRQSFDLRAPEGRPTDVALMEDPKAETVEIVQDTMSGQIVFEDVSAEQIRTSSVTHSSVFKPPSKSSRQSESSMTESKIFLYVS